VTKRKFMQVLLLVSSAMVLIGVILSILAHMYAAGRRVINVDLSDEIDSVIEFKDLALIPGEECKYTVKLAGEAGVRYGVELAFSEKGDSPLKQYAYARLEFDGEVIYEELMSELLDEDGTRLSLDLETGKDSIVEVTYYLPEEVGNEAQNAEAVFELRITANNK